MLYQERRDENNASACTTTGFPCFIGSIGICIETTAGRRRVQSIIAIALHYACTGYFQLLVVRGIIKQYESARKSQTVGGFSFTISTKKAKTSKKESRGLWKLAGAFP